MPQTTLRPYTRPHPLRDFVSRAMAERDSYLIDASTLALQLSGALICGEGGAKKNAAYRVVAEDILDLMRAQGVLTEVVLGWYQPATGDSDQVRSIPEYASYR
ncbi:hypothetical protein TA3x_003996 [Tundrisphaera sp. TA3]|uniref:hypothetical protein n=1 Tax=Tundrisphaera sp. TA3 TaxID=3435775 RepID=UPI003EBB6958